MKVFAAGPHTDYGVILAAAVLASVPPLIVFILVQRQLLSALVLTGEK